MDGDRADPEVRVGYKLPNCAGVLCEASWVRPQTILELADRARGLGYDSVWLHDHLLTPAELGHIDEPNIYEPLATMGVLASAVPDIEVGVGTVILPLRDPVLLARQIVTLDAFFPGRLILGVGAGQYESEFEAFGSSAYRRRGRVSDDHLEIIERLMNEPTASFAGDHRTISGARFFPKPASSRSLLWVGGNVTATTRRARTFGGGWIFSPAMTPEQIGPTLSPDGEPIPEGFRIALSATAHAATPADNAGDHRIHQHARVFAGAPERVAERINAYLRAGVTDILLSFRAADLESVRAQMAWFSQEVRPLLEVPRRAAAAGGERRRPR